MEEKKIRIGEINQQKSEIIINDHDHDLDKDNNLNIVKGRKKKKDKGVFEVYVIIAAVFFVCFALVVYMAAMLSITNQNQQTIQIDSLREKRALDLRAEHKIFANKELKRQQELNNTQLEAIKQKVKKLSAQISIQKLNRAKQFLKNLTEPIEQRYIRQEQQSFKKNYKIYEYSEKPICIVVPTYNNAKQERYKKNIDSILNQKYENYRVIVIDDASSDNTSQLIQDYVKDHRVYKEGRIKIQRNQQRKMALTNILDAAHNFCKPEEIFIVVDGDDYLLGYLVFKLFNYGFSDPDKWVVYSNFLTITGKVGYSRNYPEQVVQNNLFRSVLFVISHLRAFYTKLLLLIDSQDFLDQDGKLFHAANDVAIFMPVLQMARHHILYLREISYFYNSNTGMNNHQQKKKEQIRNDIYVRKKPRYFQLKQLFPSSQV